MVSLVESKPVVIKPAPEVKNPVPSKTKMEMKSPVIIKRKTEMKNTVVAKPEPEMRNPVIIKPKLEVKSPVINAPKPDMKNSAIIKCEFCGETFSDRKQPSTLRWIHIERNHIRPQYKCGECDHEVKTKQLLNNHIDETHVHENVNLDGFLS